MLDPVVPVDAGVTDTVIAVGAGVGAAASAFATSPEITFRFCWIFLRLVCVCWFVAALPPAFVPDEEGPGDAPIIWKIGGNVAVFIGF